MENEKFDFEAFAKQAAEQLRQKKPLSGKDGVFTPLIKKVLEAALEAEMDVHLEQTRQPEKNRRVSHYKLRKAVSAYKIKTDFYTGHTSTGLGYSILPLESLSI